MCLGKKSNKSNIIPSMKSAINKVNSQMAAVINRSPFDVHFIIKWGRG